jgi:hypothetical protein
MWAMVSDMPAVGVGDGLDGYDVSDGRFVLGAAAADRRVVSAYRRAEDARARRAPRAPHRIRDPVHENSRQ